MKNKHFKNIDTKNETVFGWKFLFSKYYSDYDYYVNLVYVFREI